MAGSVHTAVEMREIVKTNAHRFVRMSKGRARAVGWEARSKNSRLSFRYPEEVPRCAHYAPGEANGDGAEECFYSWETLYGIKSSLYGNRAIS